MALETEKSYVSAFRKNRMYGFRRKGKMSEESLSQMAKEK